MNYRERVRDLEQSLLDANRLLMMAVCSAGGRIDVSPRAAIEVKSLILHRGTDPETGGLTLLTLPAR